MIIQTKNQLDVGVPKTFLTNGVAAGATVLPWKNPNAFSASWAIQLGKTGEEQSEVVLLGTSTPSGTAGTVLSAILYDHPADTPIYAIKYNQVVFEASASGTAGTATPLSGGTVTIQADNEFTQFDDTTSGTSAAWRTYFRNSALAVTSTESDWITLTSVPSFYSLAFLRQRVKNKLFDSAYIKDDSVIDDWINEGLEQMNNAAIAVNEGYSLGTTTVAFAGNTNFGTITASDFKNIERAWFVDNSGTYMMNKMENNSFSPNRSFVSTMPFFALSDDNVIEVRPENPTGTVQITYQKLQPRLINDTDQLPVIMRGYTNFFVNYALAQALWKDSKLDLAQVKESLAMGQLQKFQQDIAPSVRTGPTMVQIVEGVGDDTPWWI